MIKNAFILLVILVVFTACDVIDPDEKLNRQISEQTDNESVHLDYNGIISTDEGQVASITLANDSTHTIQYFAYSESFLLYNEEARTDTGWTNLMWGWCGTGAEYYPLQPGESINFEAFLPLSSCTWRLVLEIAGLNMEYIGQIRSENIIYNIIEE